jgi:hypothetical protein
MQTRTPRALVAAAALALFASACTDAPTAPSAARAPGGRASLSSGSGPTLVSTAVKYRDTGGRPATGRSGNAVVDAMALLNKEGVATIQFSTRHATDWWHYGYINKAQIKASAPDGRHKFTRNLVESDPWYGPQGPIPGVVQIGGLGRGDEIQVQANVEGIDPHRVDVVTVTERVKALPDLTVQVVAPAEAQTGTPLNVLATVRERNGDMGAYGVCELLVGGEPVDYGWGVWVDAGDAVTCALTWTPQVPGTYPLEVRVRMPWDSEWDTTNNTDTDTVQVTGEGPRFHTSAYFDQTTTVDSSRYFDSWINTQEGYGYEYSDERFETFTGQQAYFHGSMPASISGPLDVRVSMSTGGRVVDTAEWSYEAGGSFWCTDHWTGRAAFWMCSGGGMAWQFTDFSYAFTAGSVTYHSRGYSKAWDQLSSPEEYVYHWNHDYSFDDTVPLGDDWTFDVRLNTPGGEHVLNRSLQLVRSEPWGSSYPYECFSWEDPDWGFTSKYCIGYSYRSQSISGFESD